MENQFLLCLFFFLGLWVIQFTIEFFYRKFSMNPEISRKICHLATVSPTLLLPYILKNHWYMLFFSVALTILIYVSSKTSYLKSIHGVERKTIGSPLLPITIYLIFIISLKMNNKYLFVLPITILAVSDPLAGLAGMYYKKYNREIFIFSKQLHKTLLGSLAFFVSALLISLVILFGFRQLFDLKTVLISLAIALSSTLAELLSSRGTDNLFIPLTVVLILILFY